MEPSTKETNTNDKIPTISEFIPIDERGLTQQSIDFLNTTSGRDKVINKI